jgi:hypothetical protein
MSNICKVYYLTSKVFTPPTYTFNYIFIKDVEQPVIGTYTKNQQQIFIQLYSYKTSHLHFINVAFR